MNQQIDAIVKSYQGGFAPVFLEKLFDQKNTKKLIKN